MKKYLAAAVVAVMVFAFAAFAAELNVNAGTLQAGSDTELTCSDGVEVLNYAVESDTLEVHFARLSGFEDCDGEKLIIRWNDADGDEIERQVFTLDADADLDDWTDDGGTLHEDVYRYNFSPARSAEEIEELVVAIHTGS